MTAIVFRAVPGAEAGHAAHAERMLTAMSARGGGKPAIRVTAGATLGASRHSWESEIASADVVCARGALTVVADATLYYTADLVRKIGPTAALAANANAAELIAAAYETFGDACVASLEGDFAFVLWDERRQRVLAARDFVGKRPLHYFAREKTLLVASHAAGVVADPAAPRELNLATIGATAVGLWGHSPECCYRDVYELAAGHAFTWQAGSAPVVSRFWYPPTERTRDSRSMDDAAAELRELLARAAGERMARAGSTVVTLSGGWDSTAVYGAAQHELRERGALGRALGAASMSYPEGDSGREDDFIAETVAHWKSKTNWVESTAIDMFARTRERAENRDEAFAHPYEEWNRALADAAIAAGARVVLDGSGGDQLFQASDIYLSELFRRGSWLEVVRQWKTRGGGGRRALFEAAVKPVMPHALLRAAAFVRRAPPPRHYLSRAPAPWCRATFLQSQNVLEREATAEPALPRTGAVIAEAHAFLTYPYFARVTARVARFGLDQGVEMRSPLLDARVVDFAVRRPWFERVNGKESKILLRRSMRGLLPDRVLAPRAHRTGTTSSYFKRSLHGTGRAFIDDMLTNPRLADLGIIDPDNLRSWWEYYLRAGDEEIGVRVFFTAQAELWLRTR